MTGNSAYKTLICPDTGQCPFYNNWSDATKEKKINVIIEVPEGADKYRCLAHLAHENSTAKAEIEMSEQFKKKVRGDSANIECFNIKELNLMRDIRDTLGFKDD